MWQSYHLVADVCGKADARGLTHAYPQGQKLFFAWCEQAALLKGVVQHFGFRTRSRSLRGVSKRRF